MLPTTTSTNQLSTALPRYLPHASLSRTTPPDAQPQRLQTLTDTTTTLPRSTNTTTHYHTPPTLPHTITPPDARPQRLQTLTDTTTTLPHTTNTTTHYHSTRRSTTTPTDTNRHY
ncbi:hypothetical protein Pcinc_023203 [Petrolisthes cinctipes]|uniref:Uncharacterized protein n=1 Tax=Petrolisthes cinctipes TaxID=88211 RepID=A0AAE1FG46_PETCI|nr:hypothetical protein Pcinc_024549 [Petrolisthes cinctipes]KAK3871668.1 hypothetical protein Pcinc_023203 [Petrolisthes cinctipes]